MSSTGFRHVLTSESVTEGHPDKVCDYIADSVLDTCLEQDTESHVACEVLCKGNHVVLAGEIKTNAEFDREKLVRKAVREIGYTDETEPFCDTTLAVSILLSKQSGEIDASVVDKTSADEQGAGDQGIMFGYATDETPELMPLPILLAHKLAWQMAQDRRAGVVSWLRPDGKTQVTVAYEGDRPVGVPAVLVSTQHKAEASHAAITAYVNDHLVPQVLGHWAQPGLKVIVNPSGSFVLGGPAADCGVTGRKIIVDTYGGAARHGGGAFSGKDPSKVDRSAAYYCRYVAQRVVREGLARRCEIQVAYAIGQAEPMSIKVETFGTGDPVAAHRFVNDGSKFDFRPAKIISGLGLKRPLYRRSTNYGHFGRKDAQLPWETELYVGAEPAKL